MRSDVLNSNSNEYGKLYDLKDISQVSAAKTLTLADSGNVYMLESSGGAYSITLPTATSGVSGTNYKLIVEEETPTGAITIAAGSAIGSLVMKDPGGNASNSTAGTQVSNLIIGTSAQKGDYINLLFWDGEWLAEAISGIDDAITTS